MSSTKTTTRTIRIKNETAAYFEGRPLNRYVDSLCRCVQNGEVELNGEEICVHKGLSQQKNGGFDSVHIDNKVMEDIDLMCSLYGIEISKFMEMVCTFMNDGYITIEDGKMVTMDSDGIDLSVIKDVCHRKHLDIQKTIDKCAERVRTGL